MFKKTKNRMVVAGGLGILLLLGVGIGMYRAQRPASPYEGLTTTLEVQTDEATRALARQRIATAQASLAAAKASGEEPMNDLHLSIANDALLLGDLVLARTELEEALAYNSLYASAWNAYGNVLALMGDNDRAKTALLRAVELDPREGMYRAAIDFLEARFPEDKDIVKRLYDDARDQLGRTRFVMLGLGKWYAESGMCDKAEDHYEVAEDSEEPGDIRDQITQEKEAMLTACKTK